MGYRQTIKQLSRGLFGGRSARLIADLRASLHRIEQRLDQLERDSHGARATYLGNNRLLVKSIVGGANFAFTVEADDRLITPWFAITGGYEIPLTDFLLRTLRPDSHCIDVGANFGFYTCLMARFCPAGKVIGIEPDKHVHALLRDNLAANGLLGRGEGLCAAASDTNAPMTLHRRSTRSANTSIARYGTGFTDSLGEAPEQAFTAPGIRIDQLAARLDDRVDIMKIDVEGAEPLVFRGMAQTIESNPALTIVMEWSPGQIADAGFDVGGFLDELGTLGLAPFDMREPTLRAMSRDELLALPYLFGIVLKR